MPIYLKNGTCRLMPVMCREAGEGRFDIQLEPKDKKQAGYVLEFKTGKDLDEDGLKSPAEEGNRQIREHRYYTDMEYHGVKTIILFGIAFSGKKVCVKVEER